MTSLANAKAAYARHVALEQRGRLLATLWADLQGERRVAECDAVPARLLGRWVFTAQPLATYSVDLMLCSDDVWRVLRDDVGLHPAATVLQAPLLAVFLPGLCRLLLGQTLLLPSIPTMWLGDAETMRILARDRGRYWLKDGVDASGPPIDLSQRSVGDRNQLQSVVNADPGSFIAGRQTLQSAPMQRVRVFG